jgi:hypothetical protein
MGYLMDILRTLARFFAAPAKKKKRNKRKRRHRALKCNAVRFREGAYASDSGMSDYDIYYKVKRGEVYKKILRHYSKGESTNMFNQVELRPQTQSAYVLVMYRDLSSRRSRSSVLFKVTLFRSKTGRPRILSLKT